MRFGANASGGAGHIRGVTDYQNAADLVLWQLVRDRDGPAAFAVVFERHARLIYTFCFRRVADWAAAEDLVAVVFLAAWRRRREVEVGEEGCAPWLVKVATNLTRNHIRQVRRHRALLSKLPPVVDAPDPATDIASRLDDQERMRAVLTQVRTLPPAEQEVVAMCCFAELSATDAALALGVPVATVRSRLFRARQRLKSLQPPPGAPIPEVTASGRKA